MSKRTFSIVFGADIRAYAYGDVKAESIESAVAIAKERFGELWASFDIETQNVSYARRPTLIDITDDETDEWQELCEDFNATPEDHLESAASDLLAALESLLACEELNADPDEIARGTAEAVAEARAAVAKAKGGAA